MNPRPTIAIIGFMACGKTAVARAVASELGVAMVDLDEIITSREGRSPAQLIREQGELAFRQIETASLRDVLLVNDGKVLALGGGAWIEPNNRALLEANGSRIVWLDAPFDLCWKRIEISNEDRPLGKTRTQASELYRLRHPIYELAPSRIEVTEADLPKEIAKRVLTELGKDWPKLP